MNTPLTSVFEAMYAAFARGDAEAALVNCPENVTFQIAGKSQLAGKYDRRAMTTELWPKIRDVSGESFKMEVHDVLVSDRHAMILCTNRLKRDGKALEYRTVHVWRVEGGKPLAGYEYLRDQYQFDTIWN